jgi:hypothetical protein
MPHSAANRKFARFRGGKVANFGFKSGTKIIELLMSFSIPKFAKSSRRTLANFRIGTLASGVLSPRLCHIYMSVSAVPEDVCPAVHRSGCVV